MKGYGLPRSTDVESPDIADNNTYGLASHKTRNPGKGGEIKATQKSKKKRSARRVYKKRERHRAKQSIREDL